MKKLASLLTINGLRPTYGDNHCIIGCEFKLNLKHFELSLNKEQITIKTFYSLFLVGYAERQIVLDKSFYLN